MKTLTGRIAGIVSLLAAATGTAYAAEVDATYVAPTITFGNADITPDNVTENPDGTFTLTGHDGGVASGWQLDWNLKIDYDPSLNGSLTLTNFSTSTHNYKLTLDLPVSAFGPSSRFGGSLTATLIDGGDANAVLGLSTAAGASPGIYQGTIDEIPVLNLFGPMSCSAGPNCSATFTADDGLPGPTILGPAVNGHIGTILMFSLTPGDTVTFNSNFTVTASPVPIPSSAWMLLSALGCMGYLVVRGRRTRVTSPLRLSFTLAPLPGRT